MSPAKQNEGDVGAHDEEVKRAADLREWLEGRILETETELAKLREMLLIVDSVLRKSSFIPATELRNITKQVQKTPQKSVPPTNPPMQTKAEEQAPRLGKVSGPQSASKTSVLPAQIPTSLQGPAPHEAPQGESETASRQLRRSKDGMLIANAFVSQDKVVIVPASDVKLSQTTPPFQSFFVNRILGGFEAKDQELARSGTIPQSSVLKHEVSEVDGQIERITVENYRDRSRLNEILNTLTWAMTRMIEKK